MYGTICVFVCGMLCMPAKTACGSETELLDQATAAAVRGKSDEAVRLASKAIDRNPKLAAAYYRRGREHFRLGKIRESVADFDRYVELRPQAEPQQWERGIAYYYARQYEKGAAQFELYQTFHDNDVENSVWRYLCMVPTAGVDKARSVMLPIKDDRRPGMMQVYDLYRGKLEPEQVLAAARDGSPTAQQLAGRLFYAHLYLGLYYESLGNKPQARKYITLSANRQLADNRHLNRYMWDVARIHRERLYDKPAAEAGKAR